MKLAIRKEEGSIPMGGYHYNLVPLKFESDREASLWGLLGYIIIEVTEEEGLRLLREAGAALRHQVEVAFITERMISESNKSKDRP